MLLTKTFAKKNRQGAIKKAVREHYFREDVWCGCQSCNQCQPTEPFLEVEPERVESHLLAGGYLLLPDTNVVLHQVRLLVRISSLGLHACTRIIQNIISIIIFNRK